MAKALCVDSWSRQQQESNQRIYSKINEMRAWMGMPLVEVPSYETKKEEPDYLQSMRKACERAAEIVERMKRWQTRSESQNFSEATQDSVTEAGHDDCYHTSKNSDLQTLAVKKEVNGKEQELTPTNLQANSSMGTSSERSNQGNFGSPLQDLSRDFRERPKRDLEERASQNSRAGATKEVCSIDFLVQFSAHTVQDCEQSQDEDCSGVDNRMVEDEDYEQSQEVEHSQDCENEDFLIPPLYDFTKKDSTSLTPMGDFDESHQQQEKKFLSLDSEFKEGNSKFSTFDLVVLDGMERSGWVMNCENWNFHGLDDNLGVWNLQLQPTIVKDSVGFKEFKFMVIAHKVFVELSRLGQFKVESTEINYATEFPYVVDVVVDRHSLEDRLLVFDPGITDMSLSIGFLMVFDETKVAFQLFDEMPTRGVLVWDAPYDEEIPMSTYVEFIPLTLPYDRGKLKHMMVAGIAVFDPGIDDRHECISWDFAIFVLVYIEGETATDHRNWVFDPGGLLANVVLRVVYR